jgi:hypothetical protein
MTVEELPGYLRVHWLRLREELLAGRYQPQPVRRLQDLQQGLLDEPVEHRRDAELALMDRHMGMDIV